MKKFDELYVSGLHGFLGGIVSAQGEMLEYATRAFVIEKNNSSKNLESYLADSFNYARIKFSEQKSQSLNEIQIDLQNYIFVNPFNCGVELIDQDLLKRRRINLASRTIVGIELVTKGNENLEIDKIMARADDNSSDYTFFCLSSETQILVVQFEHKKP